MIFFSKKNNFLKEKLFWNFFFQDIFSERSIKKRHLYMLYDFSAKFAKTGKNLKMSTIFAKIVSDFITDRKGWREKELKKMNSLKAIRMLSIAWEIH